MYNLIIISMTKRCTLFLLSLTALMMTSTTLMAQEPYAVLSSDNTVLTFYYDTHKAERGGMSVGPFADDPSTSSVDPNTSWVNQRDSITTVAFDSSFAKCTSLTSTAFWFWDCSSLKTITDIKNLKTDNVTDMSGMFYKCWRLTSLDVSGFKTDNVTEMNSMFGECSSLTSLDLRGFKIDKVTDVCDMFRRCSSLKNLDVSGFKTDEVTNMSGMFDGCSSLTSLDVSRFKTDNVTDMSGLFGGCSSLTSLDVSGFKTDNVTAMSSMFYGCSSLTSLNVSGFKTDNVTDISSMFHDCSSLTSLDLSGFKTDNVTNMYGLFKGCSSLTTIYASNNWSTFLSSEGCDGRHIFTNCTNLVGGQGTAYDKYHTDYTYARIDGGTAAPGYFTEKQGTGIHGLNADSNADNAPVYDLSGRRVQVPTKGIFIKNGRKFVNK